jgi:hypothetical protein
MPKDSRWMAEIRYCNGEVKYVGFEELYELHDIVERGRNPVETITVKSLVGGLALAAPSH